MAAGATSIVYLADARSTLIFLLVVLGIGAIMRIPIAGLRLAAMAVAGLACYAAAILFLGGQFSFLPQDFGTLNGRTVLWQQSLGVAYAHLFWASDFLPQGNISSRYSAGREMHTTRSRVILATGLVGLFLLSSHRVLRLALPQMAKPRSNLHPAVRLPRKYFQPAAAVSAHAHARSHPADACSVGIAASLGTAAPSGHRPGMATAGGICTVDRRSRPNEIVSLRLHSRKKTPTEQKESNARLATTSPVARRNKR